MSLALPSLILWIGFFFLFIFFPHTRVKWRAAALGSFVTAVLFQIAQWAYVHFWVGMSTYKAIYGALATIPVLLLWIYLGWTIVLFGVEICFAAQRGSTRYEVSRDRLISPATRSYWRCCGWASASRTAR